jgi:4-amino-4-deoxy-L-arabinose transferase-like glycosyltransferase
MTRNRALLLFAIAFLLWLQFFLRAHNALHLPFFIDEHRHIARAEAAFDGHPARESMGKFLLYIWLAPFQNDRFEALLVSRWAVALFSLVGSAALFALTRKLFNTWAALLAVAFYAFAPFSLFYERMVLADGFAGCFGALVAWQSIYLAENPTRRRAMIVGMLVGLAIMAKLTLTFVAIVPVLAVLLLGNHPQTGRRWLVSRTRRYLPSLVIAGLTCIVVWLPVLIPAGIVALDGNYYVLIDQSLADTSPLDEGDVNRFTYLWTQASLMLSEPMVILLLGLSLLGLWQSPPKAAYGVGWFIAMWFPGVMLVWRTRTRYLAPGTFALALLLAGGFFALQKLLQEHRGIAPRMGQRLAVTLPTIIIALWGAWFAVPFAVNAMTDATALHVPLWDENDYYRGAQTAYTLDEALDIIARQPDDERIPVKGIFMLCQRYQTYFDYNTLDLNCDHDRYPKPNEIDKLASLQGDVVTYAAEHLPFYLIIETFENVPLEIEQFQFVRLQQFRRPMNGTSVSVWHVCAIEDTTCQVGQ